MRTDGSGRNLSEENREALQSETWQKAGDAAENMDTVAEKDADGNGGPVAEQTEEDAEAGKVPPAEQAEKSTQGSAPGVTVEDAEKETEAPGPVESREAGAQDGRPVQKQAEEKLQKELAAARDRSFTEPIISYLLERCQESESLAADICQDHKTWNKCFDYIYAQARKQSSGNCAAVPDSVVYEWAEDYYHRDDKAEEEEKARRETEQRARKRAAARPEKKRAVDKPKVKKDHAGGKEKMAVPVPQPETAGKPKKNTRGMEGQLDMFSMMGM